MPSMQKWTLSLTWLIYLFVKRNVSRVGEKYEKSKGGADIVIKDIKKLFPVNTVEEEFVLQDDFCSEAPETFSTNRQKIITISINSEGETNSEFSKSLTTNLSKEDLKTISNKQMLTENVINVLQKMLKNNFQMLMVYNGLIATFL